MQANHESIVPLAFKRRGIRLVSQSNLPAHDTTLLDALGRGFYWKHLLDSGRAKSGADIAKREGVHSTSVNEKIRLTCLAPDIVEQLMSGLQPRRLTLFWFQHHRLPLDWQTQRAIIDSFE